WIKLSSQKRKKGGDSICPVCSNSFYIKPSHAYFRKTCSKKCDNESRIGRHFSPKTEFKKGKNTGIENYMWRGDDVKYVGLHMWVYSKLGKPKTCEHCKKSGLKGRKIHWANKSGKYKRDLKDWIRLCVPCHKEYDSRDRMDVWQNKK
ncbi:hypothetical protein LCGC14_2495220, partial [marine sediment metagenome]